MSSKNKASEIIARMRARGLLPKNTNAPAVMPDMSSGSNKEDHHEVGNNEQPESYPTATADVTYHVRSAATGIYNPYDPNHPRPLAASESQALDPKFQKASPELATLNRPQVFPEQQTMAHVAGQMLNSDAARGLGGLLGNHGTIPSALMTGALGYGGGKLIDWITGLLGHGTHTAPYLGAAGLLGGGGIGYARSHVKEAAVIHYGRNYDDKTATVQEIMDRVDQSMGVMSMDRAGIKSELDAMSHGELTQIWQQIRNIAPFAVGAFITRLLFGTGVIGSAAGGLLTQSLANSFTSNYNTAGALYSQ